MKRHHLLLAAIVPLLAFNVFRTVELIHRWIDAATPETSVSETYSMDGFIPGISSSAKQAPAASPTIAQPEMGPTAEQMEAQLVYATEENAGLLTVIVNKEHPLPESYEPADLSVPEIPFIFDGAHEKRLLREVAARAVEELFAAAEEDGIELYGVSGYRSYETQEALYAFNVSQQGETHASRYSAAPGTSEHQTGLAFDVTSKSADYELVAKFADTPEGRWLEEHAHEFGFVIRYPLGKEEITGYAYEPWHIRYVGVDTAAVVREYGLTLEELADGVALPAASP